MPFHFRNVSKTTDNATELRDQLKLMYNLVRQAVITIAFLRSLE